MALVWQKRAGERIYQVRRAGNSLRLYTDGTFHSQYNPRFPLGGNIWDLLVLPVLFFPRPVGRVLVLGVGGGAVIRQLTRLVGPESITGIELDPVHITVAKKYFGLGGDSRIALINRDAREWLEEFRGPPFDFLVDDLFEENSGDPRRAVPVDRAWARVLLKHLSPSGGLVANFESARALHSSALVGETAVSSRFRSRYRLWVPGYDNRMGAFFRSRVSRDTFSENLRSLERRFGRGITRRLTAQLRRF